MKGVSGLLVNTNAEVVEPSIHFFLGFAEHMEGFAGFFVERAPKMRDSIVRVLVSDDLGAMDKVHDEVMRVAIRIIEKLAHPIFEYIIPAPHEVIVVAAVPFSGRLTYRTTQESNHDLRRVMFAAAIRPAHTGH